MNADSVDLTARSDEASTARPWKVREPVTRALVAECATEDDARAWVLGAVSEHRNAGHIPPRYSVRRKA